MPSLLTPPPLLPSTPSTPSTPLPLPPQPVRRIRKEKETTLGPYSLMSSPLTPVFLLLSPLVFGSSTFPFLFSNLLLARLPSTLSSPTRPHAPSHTIALRL